MLGQGLYGLFLRSVRRHGDLVALEVAGQTYTYRQLHDLAEKLAGAIHHACGGAPARVALLAMRTPGAYIGYLAALRLGACVTPLNPRFPVVRNARVCEIAEVDLVLTDGTQRPPEGLRTLDLSELDALPSSAPAPFSCRADDVAYLLFTSGSTGRPKGVPIRHRNVVPFVMYNVERYEVGPGARVSHTFDLTFDPSIFDLFVTWSAGATLVVPQRMELLEPVDYLAERRITHWYSVPSVVSVSRQLGKLHGHCPALRYSLFIGEQLTLDQARAWHAIAPQAVIGNTYGPTELTVACAHLELPTDPAAWPQTSNGTVPIGHVYPHLDWLILGDDGCEAATGELVVRGSQCLSGYLDPRDNAGRFVRVPKEGGPAEVHDGTRELTDEYYYRTGDRVTTEGGLLVHLGRDDNQIKLRGYRVELGDIEATLRRHDRIDQAVVVAVGHGAETWLVAYYTGTAQDAHELNRWLRRQLPVHMVPRRCEHLDHLPLNASGKSDRVQLREMASR